LLENTKYDFLLQMDWINMDFGAPMTTLNQEHSDVLKPDEALIILEREVRRPTVESDEP